MLSAISAGTVADPGNTYPFIVDVVIFSALSIFLESSTGVSIYPLGLTIIVDTTKSGLLTLPPPPPLDPGGALLIVDTKRFAI